MSLHKFLGGCAPAPSPAPAPGPKVAAPRSKPTVATKPRVGGHKSAALAAALAGGFKLMGAARSSTSQLPSKPPSKPPSKVPTLVPLVTTESEPTEPTRASSSDLGVAVKRRRPSLTKPTKPFVGASTTNRLGVAASASAAVAVVGTGAKVKPRRPSIATVGAEIKAETNSDGGSSDSSNDDSIEWTTPHKRIRVNERSGMCIRTSAVCDFDVVVDDATDPFEQLVAAQKVQAAKAAAVSEHVSTAAEAKTEAEAEEVDDLLWEEAHAPESLAEVVGNPAAKAAIASWLSKKRDTPQTCEPALLVAGPSGVGKTLVIRMLLRGLGYAVWTGRGCNEVATGGKGADKDEACGTFIEELEAVLTAKPIEELVAKPVAVLIETLEGLTPHLRTQLAKLLSKFAAAGAKPGKGKGRGRGKDKGSDDDELDDVGSDSSSDESTSTGTGMGTGTSTGTSTRYTPVPIILTADGTGDKALKTLASKCAVVRMYRSDTELTWGRPPHAPQDDAIVSVLYRIMTAEGLKMPASVYTHIVHAAHGSVRAAVNTLQFLICAPRRVVEAAAAGVRDATMDVFGAADSLCFGAAPRLNGAQRLENALAGLTVHDAETVADMTAQTVAAAVDARPLSGTAKMAAVARALDAACAADVVFATIARRQDYDMADAAITLGTWGVATGLRSCDTRPVLPLPPKFGRVGPSKLWGLRSRLAAVRRRIKYVCAATAPGLSAYARDLACRAYMTKDDEDAATLDDVGVSLVAVAGGASTKGKTSAGDKARLSALEAKVVQTRAAMRKTEATALAAALPDNFPPGIFAATPLDALERTDVLRAHARALVHAAGLKPTQHAERKRVLRAAGLYVTERDAQLYLEQPVFVLADVSTPITPTTLAPIPEPVAPLTAATVSWREAEARNLADLTPAMDALLAQLDATYPVAST